MKRGERFLRALAALTGGAWLAIDHLRGDTPTMPVNVPAPSVKQPCPMCPGSLADGPHFHGEDAFWPCEHGVILLTDLAGGDPFVIPGGAE